MKISIANIMKQSAAREEFYLKITPAELDITSADASIEGDILLDFTVANVGDVILLDGNVQAVFLRVCGRCTKEYKLTCVGEFKEKFYPAGTIGISEEELTFSDDLIDITQIVREGLLLAEPIMSVCSEDCKGLCPTCGIDRNASECSCDAHEINPKFEALRHLLKK